MMQTYVLPCANCDHDEHHDIAEADGKHSGESPCFHRDPTQPDGFCPCRTYLRRSTWEGSDDRD